MKPSELFEALHALITGTCAFAYLGRMRCGEIANRCANSR